MSITFESVSKIFITTFRRKKIPAVVNLSLEIYKGEVFGIIGPNGAGKSTVLKMLMGFLKPDTGKISLMGHPPNIPKSRALVGYMPENPYFYDHLSVMELLYFSAAAAGFSSNETTKRITKLLKLVNLYEVRKQKLRSFSKGMMQRAGLCFALVHDPDLIVLDEPMSGLDPIGRKMVVDLILSLKTKGKTVLFCSHILSDVERLCDRIGIMSNGKLKGVLEKEKLSRTEGLVRIYVDRMPSKIKKISCEKKFSVHSGMDLFYIESPKKFIPTIISVCNEENVRILGIDDSKNTLENIFLKTIGRG